MALVSNPWLALALLSSIISLVLCQGDVTLSCVSPASLTDDTSKNLRCGQVVKAQTGVIYHKAYKPLEANERCVWTLALPVLWPDNLVEIEIHVLHLGYSGGEDDITNAQLILTGIAPNDSKLENRISVKGTGKHRLPLKTRLATLTFSTGDFDASSYNYTGFIVQYTAIKASESVSTSMNMADNHLINNTFPLKLSHGLTNGYYHHNSEEVSTFVLPPSRNFYPNQGSYPLVYLDRRISPGSGSSSIFSVYNFNSASLENPWDIADQFDIEKDTRIIQAHDDIQMIVLRAKSITTFTLFQMKCNE